MPGPQKALFRLWLNTTSLSYNCKYFLAAIPSYAFTDGLPTVFISTMTPLAGAGLIERAYPLILGSNLATSTLASFTAGSHNLKAAVPYTSLMFFMFGLPVARPAQLSRQNILALESKADNLAIPDLRANPLPVPLPVPLVSQSSQSNWMYQCRHPNSLYDSARLLKAQTWQPPPFPPLERTKESWSSHLLLSLWTKLKHQVSYDSEDAHQIF